MTSAAWERARRTWPAVEASEARFHAYLEQVEGDADPADVLLVAGYVSGDPNAVHHFEARYFSAIVPALRRMRLDDDVIAEITQVARGKLFVGEPPPVLRYLGKGDLASFVRVVATRAALSLLRRQGRDPVQLDDSPLERAASDVSPQLRHLKKKYEAEFKSAFADAVASLAPQERTLLRHSLVDELSIDAIGKLYGIHRATAARRVAKARDHVAEATRAIMEERLRLAAGDFSSIVQLVHSQLDLSVARLLSVDDDDDERSRASDRDS